MLESPLNNSIVYMVSLTVCSPLSNSSNGTYGAIVDPFLVANRKILRRCEPPGNAKQYAFVQYCKNYMTAWYPVEMSLPFSGIVRLTFSALPM